MRSSLFDIFYAINLTLCYTAFMKQVDNHWHATVPRYELGSCSGVSLTSYITQRGL